MSGWTVSGLSLSKTMQIYMVSIMDIREPVPANRPSFSLDMKRMHLNPLTLRFTGVCEQFEAPFQRDDLEKTLKHIRFALPLAAALFALFGILDAILIPEQKHLTWAIRYGVVCPAIMLVMAASQIRLIQPWIQMLLSGLIVISGGGIIVMILIAPPPVNYSYYAGLILVFIFGYTFVRAHFIWASLGSWVVVILYEIAAIGMSATPVPVLINNNFFFISANIAGMLTCYSFERYARRDFFMLQLLSQEREKVSAANRELEQRVEARTCQLAEINDELATEINERERAEKDRIRLADQLKQAEKMEAIGSLAAGVAHDLNNILSGLVSYPELILMELPEESPLREPIITIKTSGEKAAAMVQDLLTLARRGVADKTVINANQTILDFRVSPEFLNLIKEHPKVRFETDLDEDLLNITASSIHFSKTLMNLVANAAEALLVEGVVTIATVNRYVDQPLDGYERIAEGDYAVISVRDTGTGIAQEDLTHIFEPFFTKKRMGRSGTGLGMSVVWSTVKDLGGFIDIHSKEGYGTIFSLYLPASRETVTAEKKRITIEDYRGDERVLVVDDVAEQREIAARMLGKLGYSVAVAPSGEEALDFLQGNVVDIVVLDMIMEPRMDGCETYRRMIAQQPGQKAIIASGYSESDRVREVQRLGAGVYIKKPYTLEKLALAVREELDKVSADPPLN